MFKLYIRVANHRNHDSKHGAARPWQHLRKTTAKLRSHLRETEVTEAEKKQAPRSQTAKPNPTTRNPRNYKHKSMRPWQHLRKQEGGDYDGEDEEPPETDRSDRSDRSGEEEQRQAHVHKTPQPATQNLQHKSTAHHNEAQTSRRPRRRAKAWAVRPHAQTREKHNMYVYNIKYNIACMYYIYM